jgi:ribonuclease HI
MTIEIYTDGASRGNPGPGSYAFIVVEDDEVLHSGSGFLGTSTNNQAEYTAVIKALDHAIQEGYQDITLYSDSQLMINQLNGEWQVKNERLRELYDEVQERLKQVDVAFTNVPRENEHVDKADTLCNKELDDQGH